MECDKIKILMNEYIDNQIAKGGEGVLFTHLAHCEDCRNEFKELSLIENKTVMHMKEVPAALDERIFADIKKENKSFAQKYIQRRSPVYINYFLAAVILIIVFISFRELSQLKTEMVDFKSKYEATLHDYKLQNEKLNMVNQSIRNADLFYIKKTSLN